MSNKNKTVSFRVNEDSFDSLREIADDRDISLSKVFREYVEMMVAHDGDVRLLPAHEVSEPADGGESFPPKVTVTKRFVREHERLELEAEHLRDQLDEYRRYATKLADEVEALESEDVIHLEDLDSDSEMEVWNLG